MFKHQYDHIQNNMLSKYSSKILEGQMNRTALIFGLCNYFYLMTNVIFSHLCVFMCIKNTKNRMRECQRQKWRHSPGSCPLFLPLSHWCELLDIIANDKFSPVNCLHEQDANGNVCVCVCVLNDKQFSIYVHIQRCNYMTFRFMR